MEWGSGQPCVLVVSQDPIARDIHAQFLRMAAYDVAVAETGERALLMLRQAPRRIDWLFTPISLSGLVDGWMLAEEYHRFRPRRAVIMATDDEGDRSIETQSLVFLPNPVSPVELVARFHKLTGRNPSSVEAPQEIPLVAKAAAVPPPASAPHRRAIARRAAS